VSALEIGIWSAHLGAVLVVSAGLAVAMFSRRRLAAIQALVFIAIASTYVSSASGFLLVVWPSLGADASRVALVSGPLAGASSLGLLVQWFATERLSRLLNLTLLWGTVALLASSLVCAALPMPWALVLSLAAVWAGGIVGTLVTWRVAYDGDQLAWTMLGSCCCMLVTVSGLSWGLLTAHNPPVWVQVVTAVSAVAFYLVAGTAVALRVRYYTAISQALRRGTAVDGLTQLPTGIELQQRLMPLFARAARIQRTLVLVGVHVANATALGATHGTRARDQAFYALSLRLRATVGTRYSLGRSREDGFVLVVDEPRSFQAARLLAFRLTEVLRRPMMLQAFQINDPNIEWTPVVGVGVSPVVVDPTNTGMAIEQAMSIAEQCAEFASGAGTTDPLSREIVELRPQDA
jgi:GGDEF domain-containing protein